jgi:hypothetical protein
VSEDRSVFSRGIRIIGSYITQHPLPFGIAVGGAAVYAAATVGGTIVLPSRGRGGGPGAR